MRGEPTSATRQWSSMARGRSVPAEAPAWAATTAGNEKAVRSTASADAERMGNLPGDGVNAATYSARKAGGNSLGRRERGGGARTRPSAPRQDSQRILRIHARHEELATVDVRELVDEPQPVVHDRLRGVTPRVVDEGHEVPLQRFGHRGAGRAGTRCALHVGPRQLR